METFCDRLKHIEEAARDGRIFRVDKHEVDDEDLPPTLRNIQTIVQFFSKEEDRYTEYYYRGRVRQKRRYEEAVQKLARSIHNRLVKLKKLGVRQPPRDEIEKRKRKLAKIDRTVYVATPASDMGDAYDTLVSELWTRGFTVVPNIAARDDDDPLPTGALPDDEGAARDMIRASLARAEASIHLVGVRRGQGGGLGGQTVSFQLEAAREEAARRPAFCRMIWAPKIVPGLVAKVVNGAPEPFKPRDAVDVVEAFDELVDSDATESDTEANFVEFVLQRLRPANRARPR
jgi:hypothetical protein